MFLSKIVAYRLINNLPINVKLIPFEEGKNSAKYALKISLLAKLLENDKFAKFVPKTKILNLKNIINEINKAGIKKLISVEMLEKFVDIKSLVNQINNNFTDNIIVRLGTDGCFPGLVKSSTCIPANFPNTLLNIINDILIIQDKLSRKNRLDKIKPFLSNITDNRENLIEMNPCAVMIQAYPKNNLSDTIIINDQNIIIETYEPECQHDQGSKIAFVRKYDLSGKILQEQNPGQIKIEENSIMITTNTVSDLWQQTKKNHKNFQELQLEFYYDINQKCFYFIQVKYYKRKNHPTFLNSIKDEIFGLLPKNNENGHLISASSIRKNFFLLPKDRVHVKPLGAKQPINNSPQFLPNALTYT